VTLRVGSPDVFVAVNVRKKKQRILDGKSQKKKSVEILEVNKSK
jgi:hypothetical protein